MCAEDEWEHSSQSSGIFQFRKFVLHGCCTRRRSKNGNLGRCNKNFRVQGYHEMKRNAENKKEWLLKKAQPLGDGDVTFCSFYAWNVSSALIWLSQKYVKYFQTKRVEFGKTFSLYYELNGVWYLRLWKMGLSKNNGVLTQNRALADLNAKIFAKCNSNDCLKLYFEFGYFIF